MRFFKDVYNRVIMIIVTDVNRGHVHRRWERGGMLSWCRRRR
jgi:hypothetical protein